jgi:ABC-type Fe3+-hydroxamate transport system substrate-binding protein
MVDARTTRSLRVVSLVPSVTETLLKWGVVPVGVTRFCEQPHLNAVGGTKDPDVETIVALRPDLVVLCDEENRLEDHDALTAAGVAALSLTIRAVADVVPELRRLADAIGIEGPVDAPEIEPDPSDRRRTSFVPIWRRPWMTINRDTYGASMLSTLGVDTIFEDADDRYPTVTLDDVVARHPDVVLAPSEPYPFRERHRVELERVAPVKFVDGQDLFWWGVRTAAAQRRLAAVVG